MKCQTLSTWCSTSILWNVKMMHDVEKFHSSLRNFSLYFTFIFLNVTYICVLIALYSHHVLVLLGIGCLSWGAPGHAHHALPRLARTAGSECHPLHVVCVGLSVDARKRSVPRRLWQLGESYFYTAGYCQGQR